MRTAARFVIGALATALFCAALSPVALYLYGLTLLPDDRAPENPEEIPPKARILLWRELGGEDHPRLPLLNPYNHFSEPSGPGMSLAIAAGRSLFRTADVPRPWMPAFFSSVVWASRNWSTEEALSTVLARAYYGHGFYGLDAAAQGYFGLPASSLDWLETAQLVVLWTSPSRFDPWCSAESNQERARALVFQDAPRRISRLQPPPAGECS